MLVAQKLPDPQMLQGSAQEVMAWVILAMIVLFITTCIYFIKRQSAKEAKYDELQCKFIKLIVRSNRAMEAVAKLPPPTEDDDAI